MIRFPKNFVAIKGYPGYFWNVEEDHLYSIKISGILTPLKEQNVGSYLIARFGGFTPNERYYNISQDGRSRILTVAKINRIIEKDHTIPTRRN